MEIKKLFSRLTIREKEVFLHVIQGQSNKTIANLLGISEHTVEQHLQHIYVKLKVGSRAEAVWLYWQAVSKY